MPDLGTKWECTSCSTKFYDLGKDQPVCPKCGLNQLAEEVEEPEPDVAEEAEAEKAPGEAEESDDEPAAEKPDK